MFQAKEKAGKPKAMSVGKILRTVIAEVEVYEITIVPVVIDTSGQSHVSFGNPIFYICTNINCSPVSVLSIFQYCTHMMCLNARLYCKNASKNSRRSPVRRASLFHRLLSTLLFKNQISVIICGLFGHAKFPAFLSGLFHSGYSYQTRNVLQNVGL